MLIWVFEYIEIPKNYQIQLGGDLGQTVSDFLLKLVNIQFEIY